MTMNSQLSGRKRLARIVMTATVAICVFTGFGIGVIIGWMAP